MEQYLNFKNAFYGSMAKEHGIEDFQLPKHTRTTPLFPDNLHPEGLVIEHLVDLLPIAHVQETPIKGAFENPQKILSENNLQFMAASTSEKLLLT